MGKKRQVVAFMNMKGGVCKTTLCVNIANTLAERYGKKILLIDMDPQYNATQIIFGTRYGDSDIAKYEAECIKREKTMYHLFKYMETPPAESSNEDITHLFNSTYGEEEHYGTEFVIPIKNNFDLIPGSVQLLDYQINQKAGIERTLEKYIEGANLRQQYDYILIDSPPTYSFYFISSYLAADTYIIPLKPDTIAGLGLQLLNKAISSISRSFNKKIDSMGIVFTLIDPRNDLHLPVVEDFKNDVNLKKYIFQEPIKYYKQIPDGVNNNKFMIDISEHGIDSAIALITEEFIGRMEGK